jgi:hypothetical protein
VFAVPSVSPPHLESVDTPLQTRSIWAHFGLMGTVFSTFSS